MGNWTINYKCGHSDTVKLFGSIKSREYRAAQMEQRVCPECQAADDLAWTEAEALPALTGSEKQIRWANAIRREMVEGFRSVAKSYPAMSDKIDGYITHSTQRLTAASSWIEDRDRLIGAVTTVRNKAEAEQQQQ